MFATETTGLLIESVSNLSIHKYLPGHLGGKQMLGAQIEHNDMDPVSYTHLDVYKRQDPGIPAFCIDPGILHLVRHFDQPSVLSADRQRGLLSGKL